MSAKQNNNTRNQQPSDGQFNPDDYLNKDEYDADIEAIKQRLDALEARVKDRSSLAASFADVFTNDRNMDASLIEVMKKYVIRDAEVKNEIKKVIDNIDRDWLRSFMKKIGWAIGAIILTLVSGLAGYFIPRK